MKPIQSSVGTMINSSQEERPEYSVVIPVFNSEGVVENTVQHVIAFFNEQSFTFEVLLVNDGSTDNSWSVIKKLAEDNSSVRSINLLKNYGQHSAIFCGFQQSQGDYVITMDDDMQNPPSEIIHLINKIKEGYDLVFARFRKKKHSFTRKLGTKVVGYLNSKVFHKPKGLVLSNFRIFTRAVCDRVVSYNTPQPYIPGLLLMFASNMTNVETEHADREIGKSNYNLIRILSLVARLLFNYSSYPLKFMTGMGVIVSFITFGIGGFYLIKSLVFGVNVAGWTSLMVVTSFLNGFLILMVGALGEYISRLLRQVSHSNSVIIKEEIGSK